MNDKDMNLLGFVAIVGIIWYLLASRHRSAQSVSPAQAALESGALPVAWCIPMTGVYAANPQAYQPPGASCLTINIANQMGNSLTNQYIPLFGFVGMAQGANYQ